MGEGLDGAAVRDWIVRFAGVFAEHRAELDDLDRQSGDGDFGSNLDVPLERVAHDLAAGSDEGPGAAFGVVARAFMHTGGTSGPLFGMWFSQLARAAGGAEEIGLSELAAGVDAGLQGIQRLGGAAPGDKTMIDALAPASTALAEAAAADVELVSGLTAAAAAAREGAEATTDLIARRGRASYVGEAARGVCDPGALTVALFFESGV